MIPTGSDILPPTAPFADFNNAIIGVIHARPQELIFGIPVVVLLVITLVMLVAMLRHSR
jgi:hypothetical protein